MVALARDLDLFVPSLATGLAAILLARGNITKTRDVRTLGVLLIFHFIRRHKCIKTQA